MHIIGFGVNVQVLLCVTVIQRHSIILVSGVDRELSAAHQELQTDSIRILVTQHVYR